MPGGAEEEEVAAAVRRCAGLGMWAETRSVYDAAETVWADRRRLQALILAAGPREARKLVTVYSVLNATE